MTSTPDALTFEGRSYPVNAVYSPGTAAEAPAHLLGERGGFAYLVMPGELATKVPASWVQPVRPLLEVLAEHVDLVRLAGRCAEHPAFEADYCPSCGTARQLGGAR